MDQRVSVGIDANQITAECTDEPNIEAQLRGEPMGWATQDTEWGDTVPGWSPGMTTVTAEVACCPKCGCTEMRHKGHGHSARSEKPTRATYWECSRCEDVRGPDQGLRSTRMKLLREKFSRATIVL